MKNKFLTKNTKITLKEESKKKKSNYLTPPPPGLTTAEKVHDEDGKINKKALSDFAAKLKDYYDPDESDEYTLEEEDIPKVDREDEVGSDGVDVFEIEALAPTNLALTYDAEGSEVEKKLQKRVKELNDTSEYDKYFGTKDGFGETDEEDDTFKKLEKEADLWRTAATKVRPTDPLRVEIVGGKKTKTESKNNKKKTMKRLNFKNEFNTEYEMLQLIPENYKKDGHTFLMTDNNKTYKVRWDESLKEGSVLNYKNKKMINENTTKMKKLYNYKYSDSNGKTNDYLTEGEAMRKLMDRVRGEDLIGEQQAGLPVSKEPAGEVVAQKTPTVQYEYEKAGTVKVNGKTVQVYKGTVRNKKTGKADEFAAFSKPGVKSNEYVEFYPNGYLRQGQDNSKIKQAFAAYIGINHAELADNQTLSVLTPALKHIQANIQGGNGYWYKWKQG